MDYIEKTLILFSKYLKIIAPIVEYTKVDLTLYTLLVLKSNKWIYVILPKQFVGLLGGKYQMKILMMLNETMLSSVKAWDVVYVPNEIRANL